MTRDDALKRLRSALPEIRASFAVKSLALFGSVVRDEAHAASDVAVLVDFDEAPDYFKLFELQERLSELLGAPVDLVTRNSLHRALKGRIVAEAVDA